MSEVTPPANATFPEIDSRQLRDALGTFATGVCVVSVMDEDNRAAGMTVNSFAAVSLEPPLVLWSIQNDSHCFDMFANSDHFAVNVLGSDQEDTSNTFATPGNHLFEDGAYQLGDHGMPLLNGTVSQFECRVWARYPGGDHQIIVGQVLSVAANKGEPLLFCQGQYGRLQK